MADQPWFASYNENSVYSCELSIELILDRSLATFFHAILITTNLLQRYNSRKVNSGNISVQNVTIWTLITTVWFRTANLTYSIIRVLIWDSENLHHIFIETGLIFEFNYSSNLFLFITIVSRQRIHQIEWSEQFLKTLVRFEQQF